MSLKKMLQGFLAFGAHDPGLVSEEGYEAKFSEGGKGDGGHIDADRLRGGKSSAKVVVDYVDGGEVGVGGNNGVEEGIDGGEAHKI